MENIIKKAIEKEWDSRFIEVTVSRIEVEELAVLDPLFWQALSKACGWTIVCNNCGDKVLNMDFEGWCPLCEKEGADSIEEWKKNALRFHEINLTKGWSRAVEYVTNLVSNK